jgi:hypothetical protein
MADKGRLSVEQRIKTELFFTETRSVVVTQRRFHAHFRLFFSGAELITILLAPVTSLQDPSKVYIRTTVHLRRRESHRKQMHVISPSLLE